MIKANEAREIVANYFETIEKEKKDMASQFCEEISTAIEAKSKRGVKYLTIDRKPHTANNYIIKELIENGYKASYSSIDYKITIEW